MAPSIIIYQIIYFYIVTYDDVIFVVIQFVQNQVYSFKEICKNHLLEIYK